MLHGYGANKECFNRQIYFFSRFRRVVAVDMRGFGESEEPTSAYSLDDYASDIKAVLDELGEKGVDVLAHSFGARVAVRLLKTDDRINKLVFTGAAGLTPRRSFRYRYRRASFILLKNFLPREKLLRFYSADYISSSTIMRETFKKIVADNLDEEYAVIRNKTLLIFGEKDGETPLYMAAKMHRLMKNSTLVKFKNAGHFCFVDRADDFNGEVFSFLCERNSNG